VVTQPSIEARISVQERMITLLHGRIEELSQDMAASFDQLAKYQIATERTLATRFNLVDARLERIETTLATKEDLASLESRVEQRFTSLENKTDQRFDQVDARFASLESKFDSMLHLLTVLTKRAAE